MNESSPSRLTLILDGAIESCWLVALVVTPLYFNVLSYRIFEPDKAALLRSLAIVMLIAWAVRAIESRRRDGARTGSAPGDLNGLPASGAPVVISVAALFIWYVAASVLSIEPRLSFQGSYTRQQGLQTWAAYLVVFGSIITGVRRRDQLERIVTTVLVVSLPVSFYGIVQHFGADPLMWRDSILERVPSTMGNPIFVSGFLIMTVPPAVYRLTGAWVSVLRAEGAVTNRILVAGSVLSFFVQLAAWTRSPAAGTVSALITVGAWIVISILRGKALVPLVRLASYVVLLSTQLICIAFSGSRGPMLGLTVGLLCLAITWMLIARRPRVAKIAFVSGVATLLFLLAINVHGPSSDAFRQLPGVGRLARLLNVEEGTTRVRMLIWRGTIELMESDRKRMLIGYGPETLQLKFSRHYQPGLAYVGGRRAVPDRAHNEILDIVEGTGLLGAVIYLALILAVFWRATRWMGLLTNNTDRTVFWMLMFLCSSAVTAVACAAYGSWLIGISLMIGLLSGLFAYFGYAVLRSSERSNPGVMASQILVAVFLAAIVAHLFEIHVGIAVVATRTMFWVYLAALVVAGSRPALMSTDRRRIRDETSERDPRGRPMWPGAGLSWDVIAMGLLQGVVLSVLIFNFQVGRPSSVWAAPGLVWLLAFTVLLAGVLLIADTLPDRGARVSTWARATGVYSILCFLPTALLLATRWVAEQLSFDSASTFMAFVILMMVLVALVALSLAGGRGETTRSVRPRGLVAIVAGGILAVLLVNANLRPIRADIHFRSGMSAADRGRHQDAVEIFREVIALEPSQDRYYLELARSLASQARLAGEEAALELFTDAQGALEKARRLNPHDAEYTTNLARLHSIWGQGLEDPSDRQSHLGISDTLYARATDMSPNTAYLWNERAIVQLQRGDTISALNLFGHSLAIDDAYGETYALIGQIYVTRRDWPKAAEYYRRAARLSPGSQSLRRLAEETHRKALDADDSPSTE